MIDAGGKPYCSEEIAKHTPTKNDYAANVKLNNATDLLHDTNINKQNIKQTNKLSI